MAKLIREVGMMGLAMGIAATAWAQSAPPPPPPAPPAAPVVAPAAPVAPVLGVLMPPDVLAPMAIDMQRLRDELRWSTDLLALDSVRLDAMEQARQAVEEARLFEQDRRVTFAPAFPGSDAYASGKDLLNSRRYEDAIARFDRVIAQKGGQVEGALYWKAYAQYRLGKADESLVTIGQLRRDHPQSRYLNDAKMLEADARRRAGQPTNPADLDDDELKLLAITAIQRTDPERATPLLEGVLSANNSLRVKKQALYVLALSTQPKARQILLSYAKGAGNPDLQIEAIRYITANRDKQTTGADLVQIYQSSSDTDVKLAVLNAARGSRDTSFTLANAYVNTTSPALAPTVVRTFPARGQGLIGPAELWTLYEKETVKNLKLQMVSLFGGMEQGADHLQRIVKTEKDADVRSRALRELGTRKTEQTGQLLVDLYSANSDVETRKMIISALGAQNNAEALVGIARKEPSLALKTEIVRKLSDLAPKSKVAADYLMEIIK